MNENQAMPALTVTDVNRYIKALLTSDEVLSSVAIRGEISNFKAHSSGHMYFTLKDEGAEIAAVMFRGDAARMKFRPADGMRVLVYGSVDVYEKSGRYQVYVRTMLADGIGAMALAYERLKKQLEGEGLFDEARKKPIPEYPECIGIITAPTGAAIRDILNITGRRYPQAKILLYPSLVQGSEAPDMLCSGIAYFNAARCCDVIILGRGGGSMEDLWAFNDEKLVRMVAASQIPVISAVGHEIDFTLCDFAADRRAPTPSAAAELAVPDRKTLLELLGQKQSHMERSATQRIHSQKQRVLQKKQALGLLSPEEKLRRIRQRIEYDQKMLERSVERRTEKERARLQTMAERLNALNPLAVLQRGYSAVRDSEERIVASSKQLKKGQQIKLILRDGEANAEILSVKTFRNQRKGEKTK